MTLINNLHNDISKFIDSNVIDSIKDYISIPCVSLAYKENWHKDMDLAVEHVSNWLIKYLPADATLKIFDGANPNSKTKFETKTICVHVPSKNSKTDSSVLLYGHIDKQPEMEDWKEGLGPWNPVIKENKLYGRGGADDGYAAYSSLSALVHAKSHPELLIIIETSEESGSVDLEDHIELIKKSEFKEVYEKIGLVICLDSGALTFDRLWKTTSLRGTVSCSVKVSVLNGGLHSGVAGGFVPSSWIILNQLLERIVDFESQRIKLNEISLDKRTLDEININSNIIKDSISQELGVIDNLMLLNDVESALKDNTFGYSLEIIGFNGAPNIENAGNVHQPFSEIKICFRLPPKSDGKELIKLVEDAFTNDIPYNAKVDLVWESEVTKGWIDNGLNLDINVDSERFFNEVSVELFDKVAGKLGEGGTIPFINMLQNAFPNAGFLITGVLGPETNAHGPNEFLDIDYMKKLTTAIAYVLENI